MLMTTQDQPAGYEIVEVIGVVQGNTVRARNIGRDFLAGLRNVIGGEITEYTELLSQAREQAIKRMTDKAAVLGANAIVAVRFETSDIMQAAAELFVYGTAVVVRKIDD
jgi:uncharacterized protein YbjQ (UPF0145 family)